MKAIQRWLDYLFPEDQFCPVCGETPEAGRRAGFCAVCREALRPPAPGLCQGCRVRLTHTGAICVTCQSLGIRPLWALGAHTGILRQAVHRLKYGNWPILGQRLGELLGQNPELQRWGAGLVVPVPLHQQRERQRGYNQAALVASGLAVGLSIPVGKVLIRIRATTSQTHLDGETRRRNVAGAFGCAQPNTVRGRRILLVDDVVTTGATARECVRVLISAGAAAVGLAVVAVAELDNR